MTGASIIAALLCEQAGVTVLVPTKNIKIGRLPDGVELPALLVRTVTSLDWQPLKRGATGRTTDRVAVTVRAASYRHQAAIIAAIRSADIAGRTGDVGGARAVAVLSAGTGPDVNGPADSFEQTTDFRVTFATDA